MVGLLAVTPTLPPVQVPVAAAPVATKLAGKVSVKLNVCVGLPAGWLTVNVKLVVAPETMEAANCLFNAGVAAMICSDALAVLPTSGPAALIAPEVLL